MWNGKASKSRLGLAVRPHRAPSFVSFSKALYPHCNFSTDSRQKKYPRGLRQYLMIDILPRDICLGRMVEGLQQS